MSSAKKLTAMEGKGPAAKAGAYVVSDLSSDYVLTASEQIAHFDPQQRINIIRSGIPAASIGRLAARMGWSVELLINSLRLSRLCLDLVERQDTRLSSDESERVLGVEKLIEIVHLMVEESGDPDGFDAALWLGTWLSEPLPALGRAPPASYLDTLEGQTLLSELLAMSQSGAYA